MVVKWSACSPSNLTIRVRILLKPTVFSVICVWKKRKINQKWPGRPIKTFMIVPILKFLEIYLPFQKQMYFKFPDFQQCGIHLEESYRQKVVELNDRILQVGQHFAAGTHKSRTVLKSSLPRHIRHYFNVDGDNIILSGEHNMVLYEFLNYILQRYCNGTVI